MTGLGISLGWSHRESADRVLDLVGEAESSGVEACWVIDSQIAMRDGFALLALLSRSTERMFVGPGVTNLLTRHPTVVANSLITLQELSGGRALAGIGAGDSAVYPIGLTPQRVADLGEGLTSLRSLMSGEAITHRGDEIRLVGAVDPAPPVFLAASQPRMLRLAGAVADGVIIMGPSHPEIVRLQLSQVDRGARDAGRDPAAVFRDVWVTMAVDGEERGVDAIRSWASAQARWLTKWQHLPDDLTAFTHEMQMAAEAYDFGNHLSTSANHAAVVSDEFAEVLAVAGSLDACAARISAIAAVGADRITISLLSGGRERRLHDLLGVWARAASASGVTGGP